eukprot:CAMPEP_0196662382 /NCGR_PEP_ID=MMETSP1086-20130531/48429_1 /TAXON_ID=77921 /ORGANISM="Cyanoptyche  gloeocystis , Strain SAG4.97" /LENGTH=65 /DNA_ID=CAMNT_0041997731 /DNA_START=89 /DNA_END=283 /DNA_ORIENTATION=-
MAHHARHPVVMLSPTPPQRLHWSTALVHMSFLQPSPLSCCSWPPVAPTTSHVPHVPLACSIHHFA